MGSCRRDRHTASLDSAGPTTGGAAGHLAAVCGPALNAYSDPALTCGENSWPGRVHHRLEDSREAILCFHVKARVKHSGGSFFVSDCNQAKSSCKILCCTRLERA